MIDTEIIKITLNAKYNKLLSDYDFEITKKDDVKNELIRNIMSINGVEGIFLNKDFISINKYDDKITES